MVTCFGSARACFYRVFGDGVYDPLEILLADRMQLRVGRGIQKIDGVGDAVFDRELDGVQIVAQRAAQLQAIAFDAAYMAGSMGGPSST